MRKIRNIKEDEIMKKYNPIELKIKAKHLALEPAIIKKEERKLLKFANSMYKDDPQFKLKQSAGWKAASLHSHRIMKVRIEVRGTQLARAFLAGKPYSSVEHKRKPEREYEFECAVKRAKSIAKNYGPLAYKNDEALCSANFDEWLKT